MKLMATDRRRFMPPLYACTATGQTPEGRQGLGTPCLLLNEFLFLFLFQGLGMYSIARVSACSMCPGV